MEPVRTPAYRRREFIGLAAGGVAAVGLGAAFWKEVLDNAGSDSTRQEGLGYGPRRTPDENGIRLPEGFESRVIARGEQRVPGTDYAWHVKSDGSATFPTSDGGWILVSNSEELEGGASAIRFGRGGRIQDAYRILDGTTSNCSGGGTPWGTWLSCEEVEGGYVWECDPTGHRPARRHAAMGSFKHEAAAVNPKERRIYLTEDLKDGLLYRFTPERWPRLDTGLLEAARVHPGGRVSWTEVPDAGGRAKATRDQLPSATRFQRGEGIWHDEGTIYVSTTIDSRVHAYDTRRQKIDVIYDGLASADTPLLRVDQMTGSRAGELFVCEDIATEEIDIGLIERDGTVSKFLSITGKEHDGSECTGATFDPSGRRFYFSSQRANKTGAIYEISGPFRRTRA